MKIPKIIPPRSLLRLSKSDASAPADRMKVGQQYRVGYYSPADGLRVIWLVDDRGKYFGTIDRQDLIKRYEVEQFSNETDYYGDHRQPFLPRRFVTSKAFLPPLTLLQLKRRVILKHLNLIEDRVGQYFRVGYYAPNDGLNTVWIADENGQYIGAISRSRLPKYFRVVRISKERDYCGVRVIASLPKHQRLEAARMRKMLGRRP
jgi:hypothetical protein